MNEFYSYIKGFDRNAVFNKSCKLRYNKMKQKIETYLAVLLCVRDIYNQDTGWSLRTV